VLTGFRDKEKSLGADFVADEVTGLNRSGNAVTAAQLRSGQQIEAAHFVNAVGAWAGEVCAMLGIDVPIEPLRRFEHFFECQDPIEPLPYIKDTRRLPFRPEGTRYSGGVPTLAEPRGYNFGVDNGYFEKAVWPALAHRFPQFERTRCGRALPGLYDQNDFDGNVMAGLCRIRLPGLEPVVVSDRGSGRPASGSQLGQDVRDVHAHGLVRDEQLGRDLSVGPPGRERSQHLELAAGQNRQRAAWYRSRTGA
jgi:glycine/D-amino acid oxidase-like deaminating enzyme